VPERTQAWREEVALALILWRDFKSPGKCDPLVVSTMFRLADDLGVRAELEDMQSKVPPMKIEPRDKS